jgi:hypothetical protein
MADELEREAVLAYAEKLAGELRDVADHLGNAVAAFRATVDDFQTWVEDGRGPTASPEAEQAPESSSLGPAVTLVPEPATEADQRSGLDRRNGERRVFVADGLAARIIRAIDRRESDERRSGVERRGSHPVA